jgi:hypothetical protein
VRPGDRLSLGPLSATIVGLHGHPRLVALEFEGSPGAVWDGLAHHGRPIQYSHLTEPLALWDTWTSIAGPPVAFEPPSAGFVLTWDALARMTMGACDSRRSPRGRHLLHRRSCARRTAALRRALTGFRVRRPTPSAGRASKAAASSRSGRPWCVRSEHAAALDPVVPAGEGVASQRIDGSSRLELVNALLSGTHEPGTSHYDMLGAFVDEITLTESTARLDEHGYRTHEFGDSICGGGGNAVARQESLVTADGRADLMSPGAPGDDGMGSETTSSRRPCRTASPVRSAPRPAILVAASHLVVRRLVCRSVTSVAPSRRSSVMVTRPSRPRVASETGVLDRPAALGAG